MSATALRPALADEGGASDNARLDGVHAVAVIGTDPAAVAVHATRLARSQARRRRVVLFNLLGTPSGLDALAPDDDPHGVSDAVRFGVSLGRIARPVATQPNLFVVPGGAESPLDEEVLTSRLWRSWAGQFHDSGALMLIAAPAAQAGLPPLLSALDGVVTVGGGAMPVPAPAILGSVADAPARARATDAGAPERAAQPASRRRIIPVAATVAIASVVAAAAWLGRGYLGWDQASQVDAARPLITVPSADPPIVPPTIESGVPLGAAPWAVELATVNSATGALLRVRQAVDSVPVPTYSPVRLGEATAPWFRLVAGAFPTQSSADSLLAALRDRGVIPTGAGRVVRAPWAWLLEDDVPPELADDKLFLWRQLGLPAYGLQSAQGPVAIYAGAFESDAEAQLFSPLLDSLDIHATLRMRVGSIR